MERQLPSGFLNVDLEVTSRSDLQPLINAWGNRVFVLYTSGEGRIYRAHLELSRNAKSADSTIRAWCRLISVLPPLKRNLWNRPTTRDFNIGVRADAGPKSSKPNTRPRGHRHLRS